jgi:hypothetical protein
MEKKYLFLDDVRDPNDVTHYCPSSLVSLYAKEEWVIVRNYQEFQNWINNMGLPDVISFDHDLADEHYSPLMYSEGYNELYNEFKEKTGYDCAQWLVNYCMDKGIDIPDFYVHSMNPVGSHNISAYLNNYRKFFRENLD